MLQNESVTSEKIASGSITGDKLAIGVIEGRYVKHDTLTGDHLKEETIQTTNLGNGAVTEEKLAEQSVGEKQIKPLSVGTDHLADDSVTGQKLADASVTGEKLADGSVTGQKLAIGSIQGEHLADASLTVEKLSFAPIQATKGKTNVLQQFGMHPFQISGQDKTVDIMINLDEPFANAEFVIVAITNHPDCYVVLNARTEQTATFTVIRSKLCVETSGMITWIALGEKQQERQPENNESEHNFEKSDGNSDENRPVDYNITEPVFYLPYPGYNLSLTNNKAFKLNE
jgi:hypothetical protein